MRLCSILLVFFAACSGPSPVVEGDAGLDSDAGFDAGTSDAGPSSDAGLHAGLSDAGLSDAGTCAIAPVVLTHTVATNPNVPREHLVNPTLFPDAKCNDGTPAAFITRQGVGAGTRRWLLFLEGGGSCGNDVDCTARALTDPGLMSSRGYTEGSPHPTPVLDGFKSADPTVNPDFYDANFVQLHYCSSDQWSGDTDATSDAGIGRFAFKGRANLAAVIRTLLPLGFAQADEVFFAGSSAGGLGLFAVVDDVRAQLPARIRMVALADAAFALDYPDFDPATGQPTTARPTPRQVSFMSDLATWGGRGDLSCEAAATDAFGRAQCRLASTLFSGGFLDVPVFVRQSQRDQVQLKMLGAGFADVSGPAVEAYRLGFGQEMARQLRAAPPPHSVFSPDDIKHGTTDTPQYNGSVIDGVKMSTAIGAFYRDPCTQALLVEP